MTIASVDNYVAATKQRVVWSKSGALTTIANAWFSPFAVAGQPGAGVLAGTSVAAGVVPTSATAGCPALNTIAATGYITNVDFGSSVACRIRLYDLLFKAGAYNFNASQALSGQPSYSSRLPGTDYKNLEIWCETVIAPTGNLAVNVTYTNESGTTSHTTGATGIGAQQTIGRCWQLPLQSGDSGVQAITNVVGSVATVGTACFNVLVLRPLWEGRVRIANDGDLHDFLKCGMPQVYTNTALYAMVATDGTALGIPELAIQISDG